MSNSSFTVEMADKELDSPTVNARPESPHVMAAIPEIRQDHSDSLLSSWPLKLPFETPWVYMFQALTAQHHESPQSLNQSRDKRD